MWLLIRQDELFECVVGSGQSHAVRNWIEACFHEVGLDWNGYTETDRLIQVLSRLVSDPAKLLSLGGNLNAHFRLAAMMMQRRHGAVKSRTGDDGLSGSAASYEIALVNCPRMEIVFSQLSLHGKSSGSSGCYLTWVMETSCFHT